MAKYLVLWELDESKIPDDPKEKKAAWLAALEATKQDLKKGTTIEWGAFLEATAGFTILQGTPEEIYAATAAWAPFCRMEVRSFVALDQAQKALKKI